MLNLDDSQPFPVEDETVEYKEIFNEKCKKEIAAFLNGTQIAYLYLGVKDETRCMTHVYSCLLYTSDAADEEDSVDLGRRRIIKKKNLSQITYSTHSTLYTFSPTSPFSFSLSSFTTHTLRLSFLLFNRLLTS
ncbi:hypothetical protein MUDAN_IGPPGNFN_01882 [Lactiplantibacillus mudanjiangensis]|nr:hypothetical protein MUDAN_IGPPGNFN_01882 [Lactiplantibacillus mudanjiangensis]